jgi:exo-beta-1,3-glucanase (GH17 family)
MGRGIIIGVIISIVAIGLILTHTDAFNIVRQDISELSADTNTASKVDSKLDKSKTDSLEMRINNKSGIVIANTKLSGIAYSPYRKNQSPINGPYSNLEEIENDIRLLSSATDKIRIYGIDGNNQFIPDIAQKYNVKIAITLLLSGDKTDNDEIEKAVQLANKYDSIYTIIVENEGLYRNTLSEEQIIKYLDQTREKLNPRCTITIAEPIGNWLNHKEIAKHVDYAMINYYPYWIGLDINGAADSVFKEYKNVKDNLGKDVVIGETGWPSSGRASKLAVPSLENQQKFISGLRDISDKNKIEYILFEAFDERWKLKDQFDLDGPNDVENHWGLFYENGTLKESLKNIISSPQYSTTRN